jgi:hypothetical protein
VADDERIARLQRLAYGAGIADAPRMAAEAELVALRAADAAEPDAERDPDPSATEDEPHHRATVLRSVAPATVTVAAAIALLAGIGLGWAAATATAPTATVAAPSAAVSAPPAPPAIPFEDAAAMAVFDREQVESDRTPITDGRIWVDRATQRRLLTLPGGTTVTAVRTVNGADVCLLIEHPRQGGGSTCLQEPRFPATGIRLDVALDGVGYDLVWKPSGEIGVRRAPAR